MVIQLINESLKTYVPICLFSDAFSIKKNDEKIVYIYNALPVKIGFRLLTKYTQQYKNALHL